jgi:PAS domain S-box-containing protein
MDCDAALSALGLGPEDLAAIFDSLAEGVVIVDAQGRILSINRAAGRILEMGEAEATGSNCSNLLGQQFGSSAATIGEAIRNGQPVDSIQIEAQTRSGGQKTLVFCTRLFRDPEDRPRGSVLLVRDVTELHTLQAALARDSIESTSGASARTGGPPEPEVPLEAIRRALDVTDWNVAKAARRLQLSRTRLYARIRQLGLRRPER